MEIAENELWLLSYYRESELAGALLFGKLARRTGDDELRVQLTRHCAEEAMHAWLWTETIVRLGGTPRRVSETYQNRYCMEVGLPKSMLEILALTQIFERRVMSHFKEHLARPGTHPAVTATLRRMIAEEKGHLDWVRERLDRHARQHGAATVDETLSRFERVDRKIYTELLRHESSLRGLVEAPHDG